jgi:hypothetical protein
MGVPRCGGLHGIRSEHLCMDCQNLDLRRAEVMALERRNELLEEQLDLEHSGLHRPRREAPPPPEPKPAQPQQERRGL